MEWVELVLPAGALAEEVGAILATTDEVAASGVEVRGEEIVTWARAAEADAAASALRRAAARLADAGFDVDPATVHVRPAPPEDEWRDAWKRFFRTTRVSPRIVIVPSWERFTSAPGDVVLDLDPGRAFGTGAHASTRLCLVELDRLEAEDRLTVERFFDVGTGSGILSIAAARLWPAARGIAVDVDPIAVSAARENLERNGVGARVAVSDTKAADVAGPFDLVVANIQADVLEALRDTLAHELAPGGALVLSGLLTEQANEVAASYERTGLARARLTTLPDDRDWTAVVLRKP